MSREKIRNIAENVIKNLFLLSFANSFCLAETQPNFWSFFEFQGGIRV